MEKIAKVQAGDDVRAAIMEAVDALGGFGRFIAEGETALVKPNFNTIDPSPASTDPELLAAFVDLLHEHGASRVTVGESSTFYGNTSWNLRQYGILDLKKTRPWLEVLSFDDGKWVRRKIEGGVHLKSVMAPQELERHDRLFFLCCLKTHCHARFTGALKLAVGLMKPQQRMGLHLRNIEPKVAELAAAFSPDLTVMDGRKCFITRGPSKGEVREPGVVIAGTDRVAIDLEGIRIIQGYEGNDLAGYAAEEVPQMKRAIEMHIDGYGL